MVILKLALSRNLRHHQLSAIPLIMTVDWIIARARSGVNVMSDMLVAILLDRGQVTPATEPAAIPCPSEATPPTEPQIS